MNMPGRFNQKTRGIWAILCLAVKKFSLIDGAQLAGAFAYNAFFSLFPLIVLFVTIASAFIDREQAGTAVINYVETYIPISGDMKIYIFDTIAGVVKASGQAGVVAFIILVWTAMQFFTTLICGTNRAWGVKDCGLWQLPLKNLVILVIMVGTVLAGIVLPVLAKMAKDWLFPVNDFSSLIYSLGSFFIPILVVFLGLSLFYRLAPLRLTNFSEVWAAALCTTAILRAAESLFVIYLNNFTALNAVYGAFGGIMALLLWIYCSGCILIFGACLCAAQAEEDLAPA